MGVLECWIEKKDGRYIAVSAACDEEYVDSFTNMNALYLIHLVFNNNGHNLTSLDDSEVDLRGIL